MIFLDSNVPMYLMGQAHPLKERAHTLLAQIINERRRLVTSAEVLQELCHRYQAIKRPDLIQSAYDTVHGLVDQVFPVTERDVEGCKAVILSYQGVSARDAIHAALIKNIGGRDILSFDKDFDRLPWLNRLS